MRSQRSRGVNTGSLEQHSIFEIILNKNMSVNIWKIVKRWCVDREAPREYKSTELLGRWHLRKESKKVDSEIMDPVGK